MRSTQTQTSYNFKVKGKVQGLVALELIRRLCLGLSLESCNFACDNEEVLLLAKRQWQIAKTYDYNNPIVKDSYIDLSVTPVDVDLQEFQDKYYGSVTKGSELPTQEEVEKVTASRKHILEYMLEKLSVVLYNENKSLIISPTPTISLDVTKSDKERLFSELKPFNLNKKPFMVLYVTRELQNLDGTIKRCPPGVPLIDVSPTPTETEHPDYIYVRPFDLLDLSILIKHNNLSMIDRYPSIFTTDLCLGYMCSEIDKPVMLLYESDNYNFDAPKSNNITVLRPA